MSLILHSFLHPEIDLSDDREARLIASSYAEVKFAVQFAANPPTRRRLAVIQDRRRNEHRSKSNTNENRLSHFGESAPRPSEVDAVDENAEQLYARLVGAVGVTIDRDTREIVQDEAGMRLLRFGVPDLLFRLECQREREAKAGTGQDAVARAKIWRHVAEACKPGAQIADITDPS